MSAENYFRGKTSPALSQPCIGWQKDLGSCDSASFSEIPSSFSLNRVTNEYLEIRRSFIMVRGFVGMLGLFSLAISAPTFFMFLCDPDVTLFDSRELLFAMYLIPVWSAAIALRTEKSTPRDNPIRFNRARQIIYAYNTRFDLALPWRPTVLTIAIYDWAQVRAECFVTNERIFSGEGIMLSIVKPGTNEVIDRFALQYGSQNENLWNYICTYMQHGPSALPPFTTPRDPNKVAPYSLFHRLAQKVKWPSDIDRESTTAP